MSVHPPHPLEHVVEQLRAQLKAAEDAYHAMEQRCDDEIKAYAVERARREAAERVLAEVRKLLAGEANDVTGALAVYDGTCST